MWQVAWAHPKFGGILASCSFDGKARRTCDVAACRWCVAGHHSQGDGQGVAGRAHLLRRPGRIRSVPSACARRHTAQSMPWPGAPRVRQAHAGGGSGRRQRGDCCVRRAEFAGAARMAGSRPADNKWSTAALFPAHQTGCTSVSWAPFPLNVRCRGHRRTHREQAPALRLATGGCDNAVTVWQSDAKAATWRARSLGGVTAAVGGSWMSHAGHSDWVRDVAWAPSIGQAANVLASCSQDRSVLVWTEADGEWVRAAVARATAHRVADIQGDQDRRARVADLVVAGREHPGRLQRHQGLAARPSPAAAIQRTGHAVEGVARRQVAAGQRGRRRGVAARIELIWHPPETRTCFSTFAGVAPRAAPELTAPRAVPPCLPSTTRVLSRRRSCARKARRAAQRFCVLTRPAARKWQQLQSKRYSEKRKFGALQLHVWRCEAWRPHIYFTARDIFICAARSPPRADGP